MAFLVIGLLVLWIGLALMALGLCMAAGRADADAETQDGDLRDRSGAVLLPRSRSRTGSRAGDC
jgi:xanthine/uracil permease